VKITVFLFLFTEYNIIIELGGGKLNKSGNILEKYGSDPIHLRTIKLFRWHLDKQTSCTLDEVAKVIEEFKVKYDVDGDQFLYPIIIALTNNTEEIDLIERLHSLGKDRVMDLLEGYLKSKMNK